MKYSMEDLRTMASELLSSHPVELETAHFGQDVKKLLEELSIYHIELEHQNTELDRSEKELAQSRDEYVSLFDSAPVSYVIIDAQHKILKVNRAFRDCFTPVSAKEHPIEGQSFDDYVCPEFLNAFSLFCRMLRKQMMPIPLELKIYDNRGKQRYVLLTACIHNSPGSGYRLAISDIAMQKRLESQLAQAKDVAETDDRRKSLFLTNVSHELRTPLATIVGFGELLQDESLDNRTRDEYVSSMVSASSSLMDFVENVLDLSSLESNTVPLRKQLTDVRVLCEDIVKVFQRKVRSKNILLSLEVSGKLPLFWTDASRLRQVVFSTVEHAVLNASAGSISLQVQLLPVSDVYGNLVVRISGNDIFSSESNFELDRFTRSSSTRSSGLDLWMAKRIVKAMNGQMVWEHPLNCVRIEIPLEVSSETLVRKSGPTSTETPVGGGKTCLLVDDVVMNLRVLSAMVKRLGFSPDVVTSGRGALELLNKRHYDFILTDLWMPEMSGEELAMIVRQKPEFDDIKIYAITADVERGSNFNMDFFEDSVIKPVNIEKIRKLLAAFV